MLSSYRVELAPPPPSITHTGTLYKYSQLAPPPPGVRVLHLFRSHLLGAKRAAADPPVGARFTTTTTTQNTNKNYLENNFKNTFTKKKNERKRQPLASLIRVGTLEESRCVCVWDSQGKSDVLGFARRIYHLRVVWRHLFLKFLGQRAC